MINTILTILLIAFLLWDIFALRFWHKDHTVSHYIHLIFDRYKALILLYGILLGLSVVFSTTVYDKLLLTVYSGIGVHFLNWKT